MPTKYRALTENELSRAVRATKTRSKSARSAFGYFGSKQRLAARIAKMLPPHNAWVEAFCGSAAVTMVKKPAQIEVLNDADTQIVNVFRQLREHSAELMRLVELTPYAREEFQESYRRPKAANDLEQARRFLVAAMMTVNGAMGSNGQGVRHSGFSYSQAYSRKGQEARVSRWNSLPGRLKGVVQRLKHVRIENKDARDLFRMFLYRPATLVYLDPPYLMDRDTRYKVDANEKAFHEDLLELCCRAKCMVLVSGYDNPLYNSVLTRRAGWERTTIKTHTRDTKGKDLVRNEVLWKNRFFVKAVAIGRVPIRLSPKERADHKVNPVRR